MTMNHPHEEPDEPEKKMSVERVWNWRYACPVTSCRTVEYGFETEDAALDAARDHRDEWHD